MAPTLKPACGIELTGLTLRSMKEDLLRKLSDVETWDKAPKWRKAASRPFRYPFAILYARLWYPVSRKGLLLDTRTFFGSDMQVRLPAGTDLYLSGAKTHSSEIRLARLLVRNLGPGMTFLDIGAHYGYFSLLAAKLVGDTGRVMAFDAARSNYEILEHNVSGQKNIRSFHQAVGADNGLLTFYEFPPKYSEYNTTDPDQFRGAEWFRDIEPAVHEVAAYSIDHLAEIHALRPDIIKIDVEGAEDKVILGGSRFFSESAATIVMEYLAPERHNKPHRDAVDMLLAHGYRCHRIDEAGYLQPLSEPDRYLSDTRQDSDNLAFTR